MLQRVLQSAPFSLQDWAKDAGISYHAIRSWAYGKRVPPADRIQSLAGTLRARAERLQAMADELERGGEEGDGQ